MLKIILTSRRKYYGGGGRGEKEDGDPEDNELGLPFLPETEKEVGALCV